ncbi:MAG TPA: tetratricopeptide repeat protein [Patescibacteria group bacterium]|nr:tetratricopeptide repeat protein [Patescibacteria group bacterium]
MDTTLNFTTQAVTAAQTGDWETAKIANQNVLEIEPNSVSARNRLAYCFMQLGMIPEAKETYESVLAIERNNPIAQKYLSMLNNNVKPKNGPLGKPSDFIEEPGKTRLVSLARLAAPEVLQSTPTATVCVIVPKNHRVNIDTQGGTYLGSLPDDIAFRLQKLIAGGNLYSVLVQSTSKKHCTVFIKETFHSPQSPFAQSFPLSTNQHNPSISEDVLLDESPLDTRETGNEAENEGSDDTADLME